MKSLRNLSLQNVNQPFSKVMEDLCHMYEFSRAHTTKRAVSQKPLLFFIMIATRILTKVYAFDIYTAYREGIAPSNKLKSSMSAADELEFP